MSNDPTALKSTTVSGLYIELDDPNYATFNQRFGAYFVDSLFLFIIFEAQALVIVIMEHDANQNTGVRFLFDLFSLSTPACYFIGMEASPLQGTIGKLVVGLKVTDESGNPIGLGRAFCRFAGKILSTMLCFAGFFIFFGNQKRQTLHDILAKTLVLNK